MNDNKIIARNTTFLYIRTIVVLLISLYISRAILKVLGVSDFGVYNVVAGFVLMFELLSSSLTSSVQRYYNYEKGKRGNKGIQDVYIATIFIQVIIATIVVVFSETIGLWYINNKMVIPADRLYAAKIVFHITVASLVVSIMQIPYISIIFAKEKMFFISLIGILDAILKLIAVWGISIFEFDSLVIYSLFLFCVTCFDLLSYFIYSKCSFKELRVSKNWNLSLFRPMFIFTMWSAVSGFANIIKNQGINIVLNFYFGPIVNAARGISYQIKSALLGFVINISTAARPQLVESYAEGNYDRSLSIMYSISKITFYAIFIPALPLMLEIDYVLELWLGNNIPEYTNLFAIWVILVTLTDILITPLSMIIYAKGKIASYNVIFSAIGLLIFPIAIITFQKINNPVVVFVESFIISIFQLLFSVFVVVRLIKMQIIKYIWNVMIPIIVVSFSSLSLSVLINNNIEANTLGFFIKFIITILISLILIWLCGLKNGEKELILFYVRKVIRKK